MHRVVPYIEMGQGRGSRLYWEVGICVPENWYVQMRLGDDALANSVQNNFRDAA